MTNFTKCFDHVMRDSSKSMNARLIYCRIARFTENGKDAFPTQQWLGEEFGLTEQQVYRAVKELKDAGLINAKQRGKTQSNRYSVNEWPMDAHKAVIDARNSRQEEYEQEATQNAPETIVTPVEVIASPEPEVVSQSLPEASPSIVEPLPDYDEDEYVNNGSFYRERPQRTIPTGAADWMSEFEPDLF